MREALHISGGLPGSRHPRCTSTYIVPDCCHRRLAERRGVRAAQLRVRERDRLVREHERAVALARGDRVGSFVDRRAALGHSIVGQ